MFSLFASFALFFYITVISSFFVYSGCLPVRKKFIDIDLRNWGKERVGCSSKRSLQPVQTRSMTCLFYFGLINWREQKSLLSTVICLINLVSCPIECIIAWNWGDSEVNNKKKAAMRGCALSSQIVSRFPILLYCGALFRRRFSPLAWPCSLLQIWWLDLAGDCPFSLANNAHRRRFSICIEMRYVHTYFVFGTYVCLLQLVSSWPSDVSRMLVTYARNFM